MATRKNYLFLHQKETGFRSNKVNNACQYILKQWQAPDATLRLFGAEVLRHLLLKKSFSKTAWCIQKRQEPPSQAFLWCMSLRHQSMPSNSC